MNREEVNVRRKIIFLYTRLSGYWIECVRHLIHSQNADVLLVFQRTNVDSPFELDLRDIKVLDSDFSNLYKKSVDFNADIVYVAGWGNKVYNKIAKVYKKRGIPVICGMDNQWLGSSKQIIATWLSKLYLHNKFSHIWVPGLYQFDFARRLGFKNSQILRNLYVADTEKFLNEKVIVNKRFVFTGRLVHHKGVDLLIKAYKKLQQEVTKEWDIVFIGNGKYEQELKDNNLKHIKFLQPEHLPGELSKGGVFVLPSRYEAWGVVVQEAAASGMPIITTHQCGAASQFVIHGYNGFLAEGGNLDSLFECMKRITALSDSELNSMGTRSIELSKSITQEMWAYQLLSVLDPISCRS